MADKRYYWIKLRKDFIEGPAFDFMMSQKDGANYVTLYLQLCMMSINSSGRMANKMGEVIVKYDINKIQRDCKYYSIDTIRVALEIYKNLGLIYVGDDNIMQIAGYDQLVGSETEWAKKKRVQRERHKLLATESETDEGHRIGQSEDNVPTEYRDRDQSIELRDQSIDTRSLEEDKDLKPIKESEEKKPKRKRFVPPSLDEVQSYITEKGYNVDAERFICYYESNGWMVGRNHMKDWKATVRNWNAREKSGGGYQKKPYQTARQAASEATYNFYMKQILEGEDEPEGNGSDNHEDVWGMAR